MVFTKRPHSQLYCYYILNGFWFWFVWFIRPCLTGWGSLTSHRNTRSVLLYYVMFLISSISHSFYSYILSRQRRSWTLRVELWLCISNIRLIKKKLDSSTVWLLFTWYITHSILIYHNWQYISHSNRLNTRATCCNLIVTYCHKSFKRLCQHNICRVDATLVGVRY